MAFEINRFPRNKMSEDAISKCWDLLNNAIQMID